MSVYLLNSWEDIVYVPLGNYRPGADGNEIILVEFNTVNCVKIFLAFSDTCSTVRLIPGMKIGNKTGKHVK